ncbi:MAG: D-tyrosyl-tRNA(Tyr) deacylase [Phycisphaerae bacterium SM23_30]|nr:MAG: D-tyrosyl-tRNA(Tyr) deacylase [Phycisphaerae bacterium SM23_30]
MRAVIQRVTQARVEVEGEIAGQIEGGLLVFLSVGQGDTEADVQYMADKLVNLRIFADENDKMNLSVRDVGGAILMISQFTLHGDCRKGRRPGFDQAAEPKIARRLYERTVELVRQQQIRCETGVFAAHMHVSSLNDGPVTFLLDSSRLF